MPQTTRISEICEAIVPRLISYEDGQHAGYLNLPMLYPSGAFVTVRIAQGPNGIRVSDGGFAYRELESVGANRSFPAKARSVAADVYLNVGERTIFADVAEDEVERAILDVSAASCLVAQDIIARTSEEHEESIADILHDKLESIFPQDVQYLSGITGASSTEWNVSAIANVGGQQAVFDMVRNHGHSVNKTCTAFQDIGALDSPPRLVAVVEKKTAMGSRYNILAQVANVLEVTQSDEAFRHAIAA